MWGGNGTGHKSLHLLEDTASGHCQSATHSPGYPHRSQEQGLCCYRHVPKCLVSPAVRVPRWVDHPAARTNILAPRS